MINLKKSLFLQKPVQQKNNTRAFSNKINKSCVFSGMIVAAAGEFSFSYLIIKFIQTWIIAVFLLANISQIKLVGVEHAILQKMLEK